MKLTLDELAGAVDLFGGLTRDELIQGCEDICARSGEVIDFELMDEKIENAIEKYYLIELKERGLLVIGPVALPKLPEGGEDLPHLIQVENRSIDKKEIEKVVFERIEEEIKNNSLEEDLESLEILLDICYDIEIWSSGGMEETRKVLERRIDHMRKGGK
jgi:hypothetical protein